MESTNHNEPDLGNASKQVVRRLGGILDNRLQLLMVEAEEERERILFAIWLALGAAIFGLLAGIAITVLIAVVLWDRSPILAMSVLTLIYVAGAGLFYQRLATLRRNWQTLPATLEQLKKDRQCLEEHLI